MPHAFQTAIDLSKAQKQKAKQTELDFEARFESLINQGIKGGIFREVDVTLAASTTMALMQDWHLKRWKHHNRKITPDVYAQFAVDLVVSRLMIKK